MDTNGRDPFSNHRTVTFLLPLWPTGPVLYPKGKGQGADMVPTPRVTCTGSGLEGLCVCVFCMHAYVCACMLHICCVVCVVEGICVYVCVIWCEPCSMQPHEFVKL